MAAPVERVSEMSADDKVNILLVDDEPQIRKVIRTALAAEGFVTAEAQSAEQAFAKFREERFDPGERGDEPNRADDAVAREVEIAEPAEADLEELRDAVVTADQRELIARARGAERDLDFSAGAHARSARATRDVASLE